MPLPPDKVNYTWRTPWELMAPVVPITEKLFFVGNRDVSCHALKTESGVVLFDTAFASTSYLLVDSLRRVGIRPRDVRLMLHTHGHVDHCGATRRMKALTGARVALGAQDVETVEKGTALTCAEYLYGITDFETFEVDEALEDSVAVDCGNTVIECHHTPGHTPGTFTYTFPVMIEREKITVGLFGGPGLWTMEDEHRAEQGYAGNRKEFAESLKFLAELDVHVWLGAHPDQCDTFAKGERLAKKEQPNPFVDPTGWKRFIEGIRNRFEQEFEGAE